MSTDGNLTMAEEGAPSAPEVHASGNDDAADLRRRTKQAIDEGHDADIPSDIGYVLDENGERRRRKSIAEQRRNSLSRRRSRASHDLESGAAGDEEVAPGAESGKDEEETGTSEDEANIVWWDGDDDPHNPYNWPTWRKVVNCGLISFLTFITPLASSIFAPGVPQLMEEFQSGSLELASFVVSVYILGFAAGPMMMAPFSEIYGRTIVYHICNLGYVAFLVGCAKAPSLNALIVFRFFSGIFGSCPITNGGGSIADMITQEKRGIWMACFSIGPLLGPVIGPVAGGFLAQAKGWRWVFWLLTIIAGFVAVMMLLFMRETFAPVLLQKKTLRLRKETGNDLLRSKLDVGLSPRDYFKRGIIRPLRMLAFSPIVMIFALYMAIVYAYLYLMFTSMTEVFEEYYDFSTGTVGLSFLGLGIGSLSGLFVFSLLSDRYIQKRAAAEGGEMKPEYRLQLLPYGAVILPMGFFIYGWTAEYHIQWIVPIIGTAVIGVGNLLCFMAISLYMVDAFSIYAASALAANTVVRSVAGALLPLGGLQMYERLGLGWGNSLLGFIALALVPVPFVILRYGEGLRKRHELKNL